MGVLVVVAVGLGVGVAVTGGFGVTAVAVGLGVTVAAVGLGATVAVGLGATVAVGLGLTMPADEVGLGVVPASEARPLPVPASPVGVASSVPASDPCGAAASWTSEWAGTVSTAAGVGMGVGTVTGGSGVGVGSGSCLKCLQAKSVSTKAAAVRSESRFCMGAPDHLRGID